MKDYICFSYALKSYVLTASWFDDQLGDVLAQETESSQLLLNRYELARSWTQTDQKKRKSLQELMFLVGMLVIWARVYNLKSGS
jgi:hypothetical protein